MNYLKAYLVAFLDLLQISSTVFFILSVLGGNPGAYVFLYLVTVVAIAGPIKAGIEKKDCRG